METETKRLAADLDWLAANSDGWCQKMAPGYWRIADQSKETPDWQSWEWDLYGEEFPMAWRTDWLVGACRRYIENKGYRIGIIIYQSGGYEIDIKKNDLCIINSQYSDTSLAGAWVAAVRALLEAIGGRDAE